MCKDNDKQCPGWAKMGECAKNPLFMNTKCALSCGICGNEAVELHYK